MINTSAESAWNTSDPEGGESENITVFIHTPIQITRNLYEHVFECTLLIVLFLFGLAGNAIVLKRTKLATHFAKCNAFLYFGLSLSDILLICIRIPALFYVTFQSREDGAGFACDLWNTSNVFLFIAILTNTVVAVERRTIIVAFQRYLLCFTPRKVQVISLCLWISVIAICISVFIGFSQDVVLHPYYKTCVLQSDLSQSVDASVVFNVAFIGIFGVFPIIVIIYCYGSIIIRIYRADLLKVDRADELKLCTRLVYISFLRVLLTVVCWPPFLMFTAMWPVFPDMHLDFPHARFVDYLALCQSTISPYIIMHDTDFRENLARRRWQFCSTARRRSSEVEVNNFHSPKRMRTWKTMTSADLKTNGISEN